MNKADKYILHGIKTYEKGNRSKAKKYFKAAIQLNQKNEKAWFWLAKVVTTKADRITCLRNILVINPSNIKARRSLKRLTGEFDISENESEQFTVSVNQQSINEFSPYYDDEFHAQLEANNNKAKFNDIWEETLPICAYCATDVSQSQNRCPKCNRVLFGLVLAEPSISHSLQIWLLSRALIHIQLILAYLFWYLPNQDSLIMKGILSNGFVSLIGLALISGQILGMIATVFLSYRRIEAFWTSVFGSLTMTFILVLFLRLQPSSMGVPFGTMYGILYCTAVYASIKAYPNFAQSKQKRIAEVNQAITNVEDLNRLAVGFANLGMWGTAVQHWRRAIEFQIDHPKVNAQLANGYLQLKFKKRAIAQYKKAIRYSNDPKLQHTLAKLQESTSEEDELSPFNNKPSSQFA